MIEYLTTKQAAEYLNLASGTLDVWRSKKQGPPYSKLGDRVVYEKSQLDIWVKSNAVEHDKTQ